MLGKEAVQGAFCLGYALNCGLAADKQQLELMEMKQMSRALPQIRIRLRQRIANCTAWKGRGRGKHNVKCYSKFAEFIYANEVAFMTPPSQHAHKRQCQAQARERKIGGRGV